MTRDEWRRLLIRRRDLTGETFNDGTIDAWAETFPTVTYGEGVQALAAAARQRDRVSVHAFSDSLPRRENTHRPSSSECGLCAGTGWVKAPPDNRHAGYTFIQPCRCTRGEQAAAAHTRILEQNRRPT